MNYDIICSEPTTDKRNDYHYITLLSLSILFILTSHQLWCCHDNRSHNYIYNIISGYVQFSVLTRL